MPTADRRQALLLLGVATASTAAGIVFGPRLAGMLSSNDADALRSALLTDLSGKQRSMAEWEGRIVVCNFWATWCPPCLEEIPALVRARDKLLPSGIEFVGIAIDQVDKVSNFALTVRISYPVLLAGGNGLDLVRKLGNPAGGLPFTVVLDRKGVIAHRKLGAVTQQEIEATLATMLPT